MALRVHIVESLSSTFLVDVWLIDVQDDGSRVTYYNFEEDGTCTGRTMNRNEGIGVGDDRPPPAFSLPHSLADALFDGIADYRSRHGKDPETESKVLREALIIERGRVDRFFDTMLQITYTNERSS